MQKQNIQPSEWHLLSPWQRKTIKYYCYFLIIYNQTKLPPEINLSIKTTYLSFLLLLILPHHPLAIPTAFGAALSFSILTY